MDSTLDFAFDYHSRGWCLIPVPAGRKEPVIKGWQKLRVSGQDLPSYFKNGTNVGVLNGAPSANLADIDLDCFRSAGDGFHLLAGNESNQRSVRCAPLSLLVQRPAGCQDH